MVTGKIPRPRSDESLEHFWARQREKAWEEGPHRCTRRTPTGLPTECASDGTPHQHCRCGEPILLVAFECRFCEVERKGGSLTRARFIDELARMSEGTAIS